MRLLWTAAILGLGVYVGSQWSHMPWPWADKNAVKPDETLPQAPVVLRAIQSLARLESASFRMERVIDLRQKNQHFWGLIQGEDTILMVAAAEVVAGIDLAELQQVNVHTEGKQRRVILSLPAPRVLSTRLDEQGTFVYSRHTDLWTSRAHDLESRARRQATRQLQSGAIQAGLIQAARSQTTRTLTALVKALGFQQVQIMWQDRDQTNPSAASG